MAVVAFELCWKRGDGTLRHLPRCAVVAIAQLASPHAYRISHKLLRHVKFRDGGERYDGFCVGFDFASQQYHVALASGIEVVVPWDSEHLSDTTVPPGPDTIPRTLRHVTPLWLDMALGSTPIASIQRYALKHSMGAVHNDRQVQRIRYFYRGETAARPKGSPRIVFVKLSPLPWASPGTPHMMSAVRRETYLYTHILHSYTPGVAPICHHAEYCDQSGSSALVLQDLALWRAVPAGGAAEGDARFVACTLARLHARHFNDGMAQHFVTVPYGDRPYWRTLDGVGARWSEVNEHIVKTHAAAKWVMRILAPYNGFRERCAAMAHDIGATLTTLAADQPCALCHQQLTARHVFLSPLPVHPSPSLFVDWSQADYAPIGIDLASAVTFLVTPDAAEAFLAEYATVLQGETNDAPDIDTLRGYVRDSMPVVYMLWADRYHTALATSSPLPPEGEVARYCGWLYSLSPCT